MRARTHSRKPASNARPVLFPPPLLPTHDSGKAFFCSSFCFAVSAFSPAEGLKVITNAVHFISMRTKAAWGMHYHFTEKRQRAVCLFVYAGAFGHFLQTPPPSREGGVSVARSGAEPAGAGGRKQPADKDETGIARSITLRNTLCKNKSA